MTTVAVTGANRPVGRALLERLDADRAVDRIIAVDRDEPEMPVAKLEFRTCDLRDRMLPAVLEGADVVVHAALELTPSRDADAMFTRNVHGTRKVLEAASKVGARRVVHLSTVAAYGAHPDNPLPLTEAAPLRANPDYAPAYHALLAEELVGEFAESHPQTRVVVLRAATALGHGADSPIAQHLEGQRLVCVHGSAAPQQFVHLDDLAAALHLAVAGDLSGSYNVAADGWLSVDELCTVLAKRRLEVPEAVAFAGVRLLWARGLWPAPPGMLRFLMHPTVASAARLHAAGWSPTRSNREVVRELAAERAGWVRLGPVRVRRRDGLGALFALALGSSAGLVALLRRRRDAVRAANLSGRRRPGPGRRGGRPR